MNGSVFNQMIDQALLQVHTGFIGKVTSVSGKTVSVQPLNMVKEPGGQPKQQAVVPNCPVLDSAVKFTSLSPAAVRQVQAGDTVYCVCADRDISETRAGVFAAPVTGHHSLSNAVVVGIL